jgi:hypothetical protein
MHSTQLHLSSLLLSILLLIHSTTITANPAPVPQDLTSTMTAISQLSDGQVQAPTDSSTDSSLLASSSTSSYENPFTIYTTQTNSLGVITGMPSVVTSQPSAVTSQPASPTLPSYSGYVYANSTTITTTGSSATEAQTPTSTAPRSGTTLATSTVVASGSGATNASPTLAQATGGAVSNQVAGAGIGLVVLGLGFSLL